MFYYVNGVLHNILLRLILQKLQPVFICFCNNVSYEDVSTYVSDLLICLHLSFPYKNVVAQNESPYRQTKSL